MWRVACHPAHSLTGTRFSVILPVAALVFTSLAGGLDAFIAAVTQPANMAALIMTLCAALLVVLVDAVMGTLIAWILVRDDFPGKRSVNALIDLPFALPTVVAGLTLLCVLLFDGVPHRFKDVWRQAS